MTEFRLPYNSNKNDSDRCEAKWLFWSLLLNVMDGNQRAVVAASAFNKIEHKININVLFKEWRKKNVHMQKIIDISVKIAIQVQFYAVYLRRKTRKTDNNLNKSSISGLPCN